MARGFPRPPTGRGMAWGCGASGRWPKSTRDCSAASAGRGSFCCRRCSFRRLRRPRQPPLNRRPPTGERGAGRFRCCWRGPPAAWFCSICSRRRGAGSGPPHWSFRLPPRVPRPVWPGGIRRLQWSCRRPWPARRSPPPPPRVRLLPRSPWRLPRSPRPPGSLPGEAMWTCPAPSPGRAAASPPAPGRAAQAAAPAAGGAAPADHRHPLLPL